MTEKTIFEKIIDREIPADIVYEDSRVIAFNDIEPQAPVHTLIVPKKPIPTVNDIEEDDEQVLGHLFYGCSKGSQRKGNRRRGLSFDRKL